MEGFFPLLEKESLGEKLGSGLPFSHVYGRFQQLLPAHEVGWSQHLMSPPTNVHLRTVLLVAVLLQRRTGKRIVGGCLFLVLSAASNILFPLVNVYVDRLTRASVWKVVEGRTTFNKRWGKWSTMG